MPLAAGTRLGSYEIVAAIGAGGMGEVYRARDVRLGRDVAVKVLPSHVAGDPELRQRFEREARALAALSHPHICPVFDVGQHEGIDFLVMEYLEGETLAQRLSEVGRVARPVRHSLGEGGSGPAGMPLDQALRYGIEIADALDKAHRKGIVHRDLKPANIMLTKAGAKLLDFGLAKVVGPPQGGHYVRDNRSVRLQPDLSGAPTVSAPFGAAHGEPLTGRGSILGTFQYMAPEQLEGQEADARTDIFAFGAVLYEMLSGRRAFEGKSQASLIAAILEREPPPLTELVPLAPALLDHLVKRCLAKDPDARWQSALDLKAQLEWIHGESHQRGTDVAGTCGAQVGAGIAMGHRWGGDGPPDRCGCLGILTSPRGRGGRADPVRRRGAWDVPRGSHSPTWRSPRMGVGWPFRRLPVRER